MSGPGPAATPRPTPTPPTDPSPSAETDPRAASMPAEGSVGGRDAVQARILTTLEKIQKQLEPGEPSGPTTLAGRVVDGVARGGEAFLLGLAGQDIDNRGSSGRRATDTDTDRNEGASTVTRTDDRRDESLASAVKPEEPRIGGRRVDDEELR